MVAQFSRLHPTGSFKGLVPELYRKLVGTRGRLDRRQIEVVRVRFGAARLHDASNGAAQHGPDARVAFARGPVGLPLRKSSYTNFEISNGSFSAALTPNLVFKGLFKSTCCDLRTKKLFCRSQNSNEEVPL